MINLMDDVVRESTTIVSHLDAEEIPLLVYMELHERPVGTRLFGRLVAKPLFIL